MAGPRVRSSICLHHFVSWVLSICLLLAQTSFAQQSGTSTGFTFNQSFHKSNISLYQTAFIGDATADTKYNASNTLHVISSTNNALGRALYFEPIRVRHPDTKRVLQFSTNFSFATLKPTENALEGMAFIMAPDNVTLGDSVDYVGWLSESTNGDESGHNFAVEFDSGYEAGWDPDNNHIGVNTNSVKSIYFQGSGRYVDLNSLAQIDLSVDHPLFVWITYDGVLEVTISKMNQTKPERPLISLPIDLSKCLKEFMYLGFTSSSYELFNVTTGATTFPEIVSEVYEWSFQTGEEVVNRDQKKRWVTSVIIAVTVPLLLIITIAVLYCRYYRKKMTYRQILSQLTELGRLPNQFGAHKIEYKDLRAATDKFSNKAKLGKGGFGWVYKGVLPGTNIPVAVKRVGRTSKQGAREFMSEVTIIGNMKHRNLVPLLGWCHHKSGELLLVYEYMPNGSLDQLLFGKYEVAEAVLSWKRRVKILIGVATAMHYLHKDYDFRVVHRDVKASNVMLDADFNARLGDFGLALLSDHNEMGPPPTLTLAGTQGYMAPELYEDGRATEKTDVYSFGAVALEIATGRCAAIKSPEGGDDCAAIKCPEGETLVDWVWTHFGSGSIMAAADICLGNDFDEKEMELVLHMGLLCCHPDPAERPTMQQCLNYMKKEDSFPVESLPPYNPRVDAATIQRKAQFWNLVQARLQASWRKSKKVNNYEHLSDIEAARNLEA